MTLETLSFVALVAAFPLNAAVTAILVHAGLRKPRIRFLTFVAAFSFVITLVLGAYVLAIGNAGLGYVVPKEAAQVVLRVIVLALSFVPVYFLYLYVTGRFKDAEQVEHSDILTAIEDNTRISQEASDNADAAYHEANTINQKLAAQGDALIQQGVDRADRDAKR